MVSKFQADPTIRYSKIVFLLIHVWVYEKKENFGRGSKENEFERKIERANKHIINVKTNLICLYS